MLRRVIACALNCCGRSCRRTHDTDDRLSDRQDRAALDIVVADVESRLRRAVSHSWSGGFPASTCLSSMKLWA